MEKRGKGKIKTDYGAKELFRIYLKEQHKKKKPTVDDKTFRDIKNLCNKKISQKILEGDWFEMPFGLGKLGISKYETFFHTARVKALDFKATREAGYKVYFEDPYRYKWVWNRANKLLKLKSYYSFKACRINTRAVKRALKSGIDFYTR